MTETLTSRLVNKETIRVAMRKRPRGEPLTAPQICERMGLPKRQAYLHEISRVCHEMSRGGLVVIYRERIGPRQIAVTFQLPSSKQPVLYSWFARLLRAARRLGK